MKNTTILIIGIILVIIGSTVLVKRASAPVDTTPGLSGLEDALSATSTTTPATATTTVLGSNSSPDGTLRPITSATEVKRSISFSCDDKIMIEGFMYRGGKNPRIEFTITDYGPGEVGAAKESRSLSLFEVQSEVGVKYTNKIGSMVFAANDDRGTITENGTPILNNCLFLTSSVVN